MVGICRARYGDASSKSDGSSDFASGGLRSSGTIVTETVVDVASQLNIADRLIRIYQVIEKLLADPVANCIRIQSL